MRMPNLDSRLGFRVAFWTQFQTNNTAIDWSEFVNTATDFIKIQFAKISFINSLLLTAFHFKLDDFSVQPCIQLNSLDFKVLKHFWKF